MRRAGKPDPVAEVYKRLLRSPTVIGRMSKADLDFVMSDDGSAEVCGAIEARNESAKGYVAIKYDWTHGAYGRGRVTEAHHAKEEMRLATTYAEADGGKVPSAMTCSARLP